MSAADALRRRVLPRAVVALSARDVRGRLGRRAVVELYFAFDDPCSAVAVVDLAGRLAAYDVAIAPRPVVARGIAGDPAVEDKRRYAIVDARRLARRLGRTLGRDAPVAAADVAFLAEWVAAAPDLGFCVAALERLWLTPDAPRAIDRAELAALWPGAAAAPRGENPVAPRPGDAAAPPAVAPSAPRPVVPATPPAGDPAAVRRNERRMHRRGPYDVPAAWVLGQWSFAHDRPAQIAARLDDLGYGPRA